MTPSGSVRTTQALVPALRRLARLGTQEQGAFLRLAGPFPVAGHAWWTDDWHALRCVPTPHLHQGIDIFAPRGTPLVAAAGGTVSQAGNAGAAGLSVEITDANGTQYFYAHLDGFAPGLRVGARVSVGDVLGFVGDTGNARGTSPHVHLEVQPWGSPVPPKPFVDRWFERARIRAARLIAGIRARARIKARAGNDKPSVRADEGSCPGAPAPYPHPSAGLVGSSEPTSSTVPVAYTILRSLACQMDWTRSGGPRPSEGASPSPPPWLGSMRPAVPVSGPSGGAAAAPPGGAPT